MRPEARDESGSVMVTMMLVTMVMSLLALVIIQNAVSSLTASGKRKQWEQALHLADGAIERAASRVSADRTYTTGHALPASPTKSDVLAAAVNCAAAGCLESAAEGEYAWVVPAGGLDVFGVGYVPSQAAARETRVVRLDYTVVNPSGPRALLTEGDLRVGGNSLVAGPGAAVHSNANLRLEGSAVIEGDATATDSITPYPCGARALGDCLQGQPAVPLPSVTPSTYRALTLYDLCAGGVVRANSGVAIPCTGTVVGSGAVVAWNGWKYTASNWNANCRDALSNDHAGYYVYQANAHITCPGSASAPWHTTIVAEGVGSPGSMLNGDITVSGSASGGTSIDSLWNGGIALVAGRDLKLSGGSAGSPLTVAGAVLVGEQVELEGSTAVRGSVTAAGVADSLASPVNGNTVEGNFRLDAEFGAPQIQGGIDPSQWTELS